MNRNLKKVISAVAALAISASSMVALAANFPDVASTASYATAVDELVGLGVIEGYEDGTFKPDDLVKRSEVTKMVVAAKSAAEKQAAEAATGTNTKFTDVPGTHWASGYVAQGVSDGFINGMSDTEFAPDENVTFAQLAKMLVVITGYGNDAEAAGGWYSGYMAIAGQLGITNGITGTSADTALTRAQVAQMIDNAMGVALRKQEVSTVYGDQIIYKTTTYDGTGEYWKDLFIEGHDAYKVNGRVIETNKQNISLDADQVKFRIEKAKNFDNYYYEKGDSEAVDAYVGTTDASNQLFQYGSALIQKNDDDEYTLLSLVASGKSQEVTFSANDVDDEDSTADKALYVFQNGSTSKKTTYKLESSATMYVNGVETELNEDNLDAFVYNNPTGTVTLIDSTEEGSTSTNGYYDFVMVTYYADGVVESIVGTEEEPRIYFKQANSALTSGLKYDTTDEDVTVKFVKDGKEIKYSDLKENDVLSIAYDVANGGKFADSSFYDVLVSSDTVEGKLTSIDNDGNRDGENQYDWSFTIGGTDYQLGNSGITTYDFELATSYTLYLNAFGKVAYRDESTSDSKIGVVVNVYSSAGGDFNNDAVRIVTKEGKVVNYTAKNEEEAAKFAKLIGDDKTDYQNQVVEYSINKDDKISLKESLSARNDDDNSLIYNASSNRFDSYRISEESTVLLDLSSYKENNTASVMDFSNLVDENEYEAYVYDKSSDGSYRFVIIMSGAGQYGPETQMAMYSSQSTTDVDGDTYTQLSVRTDGSPEFVDVLVDGDVDTVFGQSLAEGDIIVYQKDSDGYITDGYVVLEAESDFDTFANNVINGANKDNYNKFINKNILKDNVEGSNEWKWSTDKKDANVYFGIISDRKGTSVYLSQSTKGDKNYLNAEVVEVDDDTKVYELNFDNSRKNRVLTSTKAAIIRTSIPSRNDAFQDNEETTIDWSKVYENNDNIYFALVKTVEDSATEVYVIHK